MARSRPSPPKASSTFELISSSAEQTQALGEQLGRRLQPGDVVALRGALGSGKTTLVQGIAQGLGLDPGRIKSPTFVLVREYVPGPPGASAGAGGPPAVVHVDGYRLEGAPAAAALDLELMVSPRKITLIEWAERFAGLLPEERLDVELSHLSTNRRRIRLTPVGGRFAAVAAELHGAILPAEGEADAAAGD